MNTARLREFYQRAGYRVTSTRSADWYVPGGRIYRSFPCGTLVTPNENEIAELASQRGIFGIEFHNGNGIGVPSGIWMMRDRRYGPHLVTRQYRQQMTRALRREVVREIGFDELHRLGMRANIETLTRQNHGDVHFSDPAQWRQLCEAGASTPGAGVFAIFGPHALIAYLVYFIVDGISHGLMTKSLDEARQGGSNHALYFHYAYAMIRRPEIEAVEFGAQWVPAMESVDRIKRHAGYRLEPYHVAVFLRPAARTLLLSGAASLALKAAREIFGPSDGIDRAEALRHMAQATADSAGPVAPRIVATD